MGVLLVCGVYPPAAPFLYAAGAISTGIAYSDFGLSIGSSVNAGWDSLMRLGDD
jgi:hypothetical protein